MYYRYLYSFVKSQNSVWFYEKVYLMCTFVILQFIEMTYFEINIFFPFPVLPWKVSMYQFDPAPLQVFLRASPLSVIFPWNQIQALVCQPNLPPNIILFKNYLKSKKISKFNPLLFFPHQRILQILVQQQVYQQCQKFPNQN